MYALKFKVWIKFLNSMEKTIELLIKFFFPDYSWFSFPATMKSMNRKHEVFEFKSATPYNHLSIRLLKHVSSSMHTLINNNTLPLLGS